MKKRRSFTAEQKAKIVLEMIRGERTVSQIASEYEVHPNQLHRWKAEAEENMAAVFRNDAKEVEKMRREYETEKDELTKQIGQLSIEVNWLKKKSEEVMQRRRKT